MNKPIVFLGPSLSLKEAQKILDADYRNPAKKGDFLILAGIDEKIKVGFIDGVFLHDYPPTPIEVYHLATRKNIEMIGGASLGALRAVELEKFGMKGIGKIFELYKNKIINADDEVAVTFVQGENTLQSEAMIDIRFNLFLAYKHGVIDFQSMKILTRVAKKTYFPYRSYTEIILIAEKENPLVTEQFEKFKTYIIKNKDSLKSRDATKLLQHLKKYQE